jgi:hypothetical protein
LFCIVASRELFDNWWNFHILNPMVAFFVGTALSALLQPISGRSRRIVLAFCLIAGLAAYGRARIQPWYQRPHSVAAVRMGQALQRLTSDSDLVLTICEPIGDPVGLYYAHRRGWVLPVLGTNDLDWVALPDEAETVALVRSGQRLGATWLAFTLDAERRRSYLGVDTSTFRRHLSLGAVLAVADSEFEIWRLVSQGSEDQALASIEASESRSVALTPHAY